MAMEFPLSDFFIIKLPFFDSDFNYANSFSVKFKGTLFLSHGLFMDLLLHESALSLSLAFKNCFF